MVSTDQGDRDTPAALVEVKVGGRTYPVVSRPHCRTCQHPDRADIEHKIMSGYSMAAVAAWAAEQPTGHLPPPGIAALSSHAKTHMGLAGSVHRAIIERRATELVLDDNAEMVADHVALSRLLIKAGMEGLADGTLKPELSDVMTAAKFLAAHDVRDDGADIDAWREALMTYMEVARRYIPPTVWPAFAADLASQPALRKTAPALPPAPDRNQP
jgi:hypothetical protein